MTELDILGAGLDIEGWSYLKNEVQGKINEMTDRNLVLRSTFPLIMKSKLRNEEENKEAVDLVLAIMEMKSTIETPFIGNFLLIFEAIYS
jgi:hypothetical protein